MLMVQRHWKIHFLLTLHSKFLRGTMAGVVHGEKRKTSAEMREMKKRWVFQVWGWPACGWASYLWWSWWWLWLVAGMTGRERERKKTTETGQKGWFLADFGPDFLLPQAMKSTCIYRRWKRAILSSPGKNFQPLIWLEESKLLVQSMYLELPNLTVLFFF